MLRLGSKPFAVLFALSMAMVCAFASDDVDDTLPESTDRVARISFVRGDVQVRRGGATDWEKAELNLPVVEGDEIATGADGRTEVQFGIYTHARIGAGSIVEVKQLSDTGIALSVAKGSAIIRLRKFDADKDFFELDAPNTTVALQREGSYRVDAADSEVRIGVTEGGEARVYSSSSGFTLKSGRSARVQMLGALAGEWETTDAGRYADELDSWSLDRDEQIARNLDRAHYDKFYDRDIYAADELDSHGDWEQTRDYGYVWRPHPSAIAAYPDWSPYRYGSWRWVPPFGWTWVNAEPWGWATYHHGRWVWYRGRWVWAPYGRYRPRRSWWYPALVVIQVVDRNVCWYPLPYHHRYRRYNRDNHWGGNRGGRRRPPNSGGTGTPGSPGEQPSGRPDRIPLPIEREGGRQRPGVLTTAEKDALAAVPTTGVIAISADNFGITRGIGAIAPPSIAKTVLSDKRTAPPELPDGQIVAERRGGMRPLPPQIVREANLGVRTGASERKRDEPLDRELRRARMWGNREPISAPVTRAQPNDDNSPISQPPTGAVTRPPRRERPAMPIQRETPTTAPDTTETRDAPVIPQPRFERPTPREDSRPITNPRRDEPKPREDTAPRVTPKPREDPPSPRISPPTRETRPPQREQPKSEPPPRKESPSPQPKREPEAKPAPRSDGAERLSRRSGVNQ